MAALRCADRVLRALTIRGSGDGSIDDALNKGVGKRQGLRSKSSTGHATKRFGRQALLDSRHHQVQAELRGGDRSYRPLNNTMASRQSIRPLKAAGSVVRGSSRSHTATRSFATSACRHKETVGDSGDLPNMRHAQRGRQGRLHVPIVNPAGMLSLLELRLQVLTLFHRQIPGESRQPAPIRTVSGLMSTQIHPAVGQ